MTAQLQRRLGLLDAVTVGAGSMIGAGVFSAWGPATDAAGTGVLIAARGRGGRRILQCHLLGPAGRRASRVGRHLCVRRRQLGPVWGYLAGWGFVVGKTASCVAIALTAGAYLWPDHARLVGVAAVTAVAIVNVGGLSRTVVVTKGLLAVALIALASVVIAGWSSPATSLTRLTPIDTSLAGVLRAAGFLFFAFAGYARIATLGEEVREPATTIPKAIPRALAGVLAIYAVVGVTVLATLPVDTIAASDAPLGLVVSSSRFDWLTPIVRIGAGIAALGVLLNLIPGVSRTVLAMARRRELPSWLATIDDRRSLPLRAEVAVTAVVIVLTATLDLRGAIGFSGVTILTYYAITNAACSTLPQDLRRWPRWIGVVGLAGCLALAVMLPVTAVIAGAGVLVAGLVIRTIASSARGHDSQER